MQGHKPRIHLVIHDNFTESSLSSFSVGEDTVHLYYEGKNKNFNLDLDEIEKAIGHKIHPLVFDLYKIAASAYMADLWFKRPDKTGGRALNILLSVSDKSKWEGQKQHLKATFRLLTSDSFDFYFVQGTRPEKEYVFENRSSKVISLFSGGIDSLSGVKYLLDNKMEPILISHCSQNLVCHIQTTLSKLMNKALTNTIEFHQISARRVGGTGLSPKEYSQKSRSFLFLSLASIFALQLGIRDIYMFENGILAMNIPLVPSRSFNNTKTAHPDFLNNFSKLLNTTYGCNVLVQNPFLDKTKGEVIHLLDCQEFQPTIKETVSCSGIRRLGISGVKTSQIRHCGICVPCILRKFAVHAAHLEHYDCRYVTDVLGDFDRLPTEAKTTIMETLDFAHKLESCSDDDVFNEIPEFYIETVDPQPMIQMTRRYIIEVKTCLKNNAVAMHRSNLPYLN